MPGAVPRDRTPLTFTFKNVGPIKNAELELGDLTIIAGRNNTGKTYLVYTLYGFLKTWDTWPGPVRRPRRARAAERARRAERYPAFEQISDQVDENGQAEVLVDRDALGRERKEALNALTRRFSESGLPGVFSSSPEKFESASIGMKLGTESPWPERPVEGAEGEDTSSIRYDGTHLSVIGIGDQPGKRGHPLALRLRLWHRYLRFLLPELPSDPFVLSAERVGISIHKGLCPRTLPLQCVLRGDSVRRAPHPPLFGPPPDPTTTPARAGPPQARSLLDIRGVRLFIEDFSPYSWALLPADASPQWPFREGHQAGQRVPASFRQPAEPRHGAEHRRSVPLRRAPFWTFARRSGTVPWEGRQTCDGCDDRIPGTYIRRAPNLRPLHRSPEASPVRSGRCCLRGCQSLPLVQRSPADERERTRTGTAPAGPGVGAQAPARTSRPTQPERGCWSGRGQGHQRCRVLGAARARKPRRNGLRHDAGCGSRLRAARSRRLASARCRAEPAAGALPGRDAPPRDHRDRLAGTTAYALEATVVLDIIHVAAATRRAVLVAGSSKGLSAFGPRSDGSRPAHGDTWLQLRRSAAAAGSRSLDAY